MQQPARATAHGQCIMERHEPDQLHVPVLPCFRLVWAATRTIGLMMASGVDPSCSQGASSQQLPDPHGHSSHRTAPPHPHPRAASESPEHDRFPKSSCVVIIAELTLHNTLNKMLRLCSSVNYGLNG